MSITSPVPGLAADSMPIISGKIQAAGVASFADFTLTFRDLKSMQSTQVKVDGKGSFVGQVPSVGEYRVFVTSQTKCISGSFNYTVATTGQQLDFSLPRFVKYEFVPRSASGRILSNLYFNLSFPLETVSNPAIGNPSFGCGGFRLGSENAVSTTSTIFEGFEAAPGTTNLGTLTFISALSQRITTPILRTDVSSPKVEITLPATPEIQINSKSIKFKKQTVSGTLSLKMPDEFGTVITDRVISVYLRNNLGGKWGRWFIIRSMRVIPGVPATFTNNLSVYKGAQVEIGFRGSDFTSDLAIARVRVPK